MYDEYPPEFDFGPAEIQLYGIAQIWQAAHEVGLRAGLLKQWLKEARAMPRWVVAQHYTAPPAKHHAPFYLEDWDQPEAPPRIGWDQLYGDELRESVLVDQLVPNGGVGKAFDTAKLSPGERAVMKRLCDGMETAEIAEALHMDGADVRRMRRRAMLKLRGEFVPTNRLVSRGTKNLA